jgi:hypothetical protein
MSEPLKKEKVKEIEKTNKYSADDFLKAFNKLSDEMGYGLNYSPEFFQQDNGSFSIKIIVQVVRRTK